MRDFLGRLHPEVHKRSKELKTADLKAWESMTDAEVRELVDIMHQRYVDARDAHGTYTSW